MGTRQAVRVRSTAGSRRSSVRHTSWSRSATLARWTAGSAATSSSRSASGVSGVMARSNLHGVRRDPNDLSPGTDPCNASRCSGTEHLPDHIASPHKINMAKPTHLHMQTQCMHDRYTKRMGTGAEQMERGMVAHHFVRQYSGNEYNKQKICQKCRCAHHS